VDPQTYLKDKFPNVKKHFDAVEAHPSIKAYLASPARRPAFVPYAM